MTELAAATIDRQPPLHRNKLTNDYNNNNNDRLTAFDPGQPR